VWIKADIFFVFVQDEVFVDDEVGEDGVMDEEEDGMMHDAVPPQGTVTNSVANMNGGGPMIDDHVVVSSAPPMQPIPPQAIHASTLEQHSTGSAPLYAEHAATVVAAPVAAVEPIIQQTFEKEEMHIENAGLWSFRLISLVFGGHGIGS
jgi:hypothetical protein